MLTYPDSIQPGIVIVGGELSLFPEAGVLALHLFDHHDGGIVCGVARGVEMGCYWVFEPLVVDVALMAVEADVKRVLCLSHVLQLAFLALDEVDDIPRFAGCCCLYMEGAAGGSTCKSVLGPDVLAS